MINKMFYWLPRVLAILVITFFLMFSFDSFDGNGPLARKLLGFLIHNIPTIILLIIMIIAWRRELAGGILFILVSLGFAVYFKAFTTNTGSLEIFGSITVVGLLFIMNHFISKNIK